MPQTIPAVTKSRRETIPLEFGQRMPPVPRGVPQVAPPVRENDEVCDARHFVARWWQAPQAK